LTRSPRSLFHTIVVVGASLGCGGQVSGGPPSGLEDASAGGDDARGRDLDAAAPGDAGLGGPTSFCDCTRPGTFRCASCGSGDPPVRGRCPQDDGIGCTCDATIAVASPSDCPRPEQFTCADPPTSLLGTAYFGWYAFADCRCDPNAPVAMSDCADASRPILSCTTGDNCPPMSPGLLANVRYACQCIPMPPVIR
jgi:hypothetical protein